MTVLTVVGNRPQFIKAAAVSGPLRAVTDEVLVHTGQHYDAELSTIFFEELAIPAPDHRFELGGGSNSEQCARMLAELASLVARVRPDWVLVYGDTNSTLAGALAAAQAQIPVAHVEAGMRSYDRSMPEELNRVLVDHASSLLLCSAAAPAQTLRAESVGGEIEVVGDVMVDVARLIEPAAAASDALPRHGLRAGTYLLATAHRAGTVDRPERLSALVELLVALARDHPILLALHPRTAARLDAAKSGLRARLWAAVTLVPPLGYIEFQALLRGARALLTDSGGAQKEAYLAAVPCITMRAQTEWTETVGAGWNTLVDLDPDAARAALAKPVPALHPELYGDGHAGERVAAALARRIV